MHGGPLRRACLSLCLGLGLLAAPPAARALWNDQLELYVAQGATRDDNVQRRPPGEETEDIYRVTTLGLRLDKPVGQQRFLGSLKVDSIRYDTLDAFDQEAHDGSALWDWRLEHGVTGKLGFEHRRALASLANVQQGAVVSAIPNAITTWRTFVSSEHPLSPRWRLELEASRLEQSNGAELRRPNDLELDQGEAGLAYVSRAGNRLGLRTRVARGTLPNLEPIAGRLVDNSFRQLEAGLTGEWRPGGHTRVHGHLSRVRRDYRQLPARDFEDNAFELALEWAPTAKLEVTALAQRDISATEEIQVSFVFAERLALATRYRPSAKVDMTAILETADRRFLGEAGQVLGLVPPRTERLNAVALSAGYRPIPRLTLYVSLRRERRSADIGIGEYEVDLANAQLRLSF